MLILWLFLDGVQHQSSASQLTVYTKIILLSCYIILIKIIDPEYVPVLTSSRVLPRVAK